MNSSEPSQALRDYAAGRITRRQLESLLGQEISPADAIVLLAAAGLPLPRPQSPPGAPGPRLLRDLLARQKADG